MRWLIFGASSFSGSNLVRYLREPIDFKQGIDVIVNFAALNVVAPSWTHVGSYVRVNVMRLCDLLDRMLLFPPRLYIHVSTPEVYGSGAPTKPGDDSYQRAYGLTESQPFDPSTPYAVSRAAGEMLLRTYERQYGLRALITRACNVYGPGQAHYRLIPKLVACIKKGVKFPLDGGGQSVRGYVYIDDLCAAYELLARYGAPGEAYHIAPPGLHSTLEVVKRVCQSLGVTPADVIEPRPERPGKDAMYWLDARPVNLLGWHAKTSLQDGIEATAGWMHNHWREIADKPLDYEGGP